MMRQARRGPFSCLIVAAVLVGACSRGAPTSSPIDESEGVKKELVVFAAASLTDAFGDLGLAFQDAHPGVTVVFNFAGSQALRTQIEEGAVADVFAPADPSVLEAIVGTDRGETGCGIEFARNRLVVILPADNPASIGSLADLARPRIKLVLAADEVPVGRYARQALANLNLEFGPAFLESVLANVVSNEENVKQVVAKVSLGEADAGIVYSTDARAEPSLPTVPIEDPYNVIASYPLAVLPGAPEPNLAHQFVGFVLSPEGQAVLASYGFLPPRPG